MTAPEQLLITALVAIAFLVCAGNLEPRTHEAPVHRSPRDFRFPVAAAVVSLFVLSMNPF